MQEREIVARWHAGQLLLTDEQEARGRQLASKGIEDLVLPTVREFYGVNPPPPSEDDLVAAPPPEPRKGSHSGY
jgi:hypothetical protein